MKQSLNKIMEEVEINVDGLTDEIKSYELTPDQYKWFLLEVGKVQELERKLSINTNNMKQLQMKNHYYKDAIMQAISHFNQDNYIEGMYILRRSLKGETK